MSQTPVGETTGIDVPGQLWEVFHQKKAHIPSLQPDGIGLGASMMGEEMDGTFIYLVGASADLEEPVPEDYIT